MEDPDGYMTLETSRQNFCPEPPPSKTQGPSKGCKITLGILLALSIAGNVALITLLLVFQEKGTSPSTSENSCELIPGSSTAVPAKELIRNKILDELRDALLDKTLGPSSPALISHNGSLASQENPRAEHSPTGSASSLPADSVTFNPNTAHSRIVVSRDGKTAQWGRDEQQLPDTAQRFDKEVWVLGRNGFLSGKHCWEVEIKGDGEWAVGVAKESVKRKGRSNYSIHEGIWGIGEYWGKANYVAFTDPHKKLYLDKKPRRIRVFLDYNSTQVEFFDAITKISIYIFNSASFSGEKVFPWFRVWNGTELKLHP